MSEFSIVDGEVSLRKRSGAEAGEAATPFRVDPTGTTTQPVSDGGGSLTVDAASLPLPTGAATEATLASLEAKDFATQTTLEQIRVLLDAEDFATTAKQEELRLLLASLDAKDFATDTTLTAFSAKFGALGQQVSAASAAVVIASDQSAVATKAAAASYVDGHSVTMGATTDADTANTVIGRLKRIVTSLAGGLPAALSGAGNLKTALQEAIPAGANEIGKVAQGTKAALADAWPTVLVDSVGNLVSSVLINSIRRLEARSSITGRYQGAGAQQDITSIVDTEDTSMFRLQTEARLAPGSKVDIGTSIPANPEQLLIQLLSSNGTPTGPSSLLVNGATTPVVFYYQPGASDVVALQQLLITFAADDFDFDGTKFGPNALLANGALVEVLLDGVATELFNIKQNEDFLRVPGRIPLVNNTGPKDVLASAFSFGGILQLNGATNDRIRVTVRDDLTSVKLKYFTATLYGTVEE